MVENLVDYISDPNNLQRIWKDYLPNDVHCQREVKKGRDEYFSKVSRCLHCRKSYYSYHNVIHNDVYPKFKYYGNMSGRYKELLSKLGNIYNLCCSDSIKDDNTDYYGLDDVTCSILGHEIVDNKFNGVRLEKVFKCSNRVTMLFERLTKDSITSLHELQQLNIQLKQLITNMRSMRFSFGRVTRDTILIHNGKIRISQLRAPSFDIKEGMRIGPLIDDNIHPHMYINLFTIRKYPQDNTVHYYKLDGCSDNNADEYIKSITKYGIPIVYHSIDFYRLMIAIMLDTRIPINDISSQQWFKDMFLPSEISRVVNRIEYMRTKQHLDIIHCLYDHIGPFSLRCDV